MMDRNSSKTTPALSVGLALLPPEGWEGEESIARAVGALWSPPGGLELTSSRVAAGAAALQKTLRKWADRDRLAVALTVGRSGHTPADYAPEATRRLFDRSLPGVEERMYLASPRRPEDLLFRGSAGVRKETIIVNLPCRGGRLRTVLRFLAPVVTHAVEKLRGDESECAV